MVSTSTGSTAATTIATSSSSHIFTCCAQLVLAKKGPLGKIWLAAHMEKKVPKVQIMQTDIPRTVDEIENHKVPMALRVSGHLLLGVVRSFSRKVIYLFTDCTEAMVKI